MSAEGQIYNVAYFRDHQKALDKVRTRMVVRVKISPISPQIAGLLPEYRTNRTLLHIARADDENKTKELVETIACSKARAKVLKLEGDPAIKFLEELLNV